VLSFATGVRSNGLFNSGVVGFVIFLKIIAALKSKNGILTKMIRVIGTALFGIFILMIFLSVFFLILFLPYLTFC